MHRVIRTKNPLYVSFSSASSLLKTIFTGLSSDMPSHRVDRFFAVCTVRGSLRTRCTFCSKTSFVLREQSKMYQCAANYVPQSFLSTLGTFSSSKCFFISLCWCPFRRSPMNPEERIFSRTGNQNRIRFFAGYKSLSMRALKFYCHLTTTYKPLS